MSLSIGEAEDVAVPVEVIEFVEAGFSDHQDRHAD